MIMFPEVKLMLFRGIPKCKSVWKAYSFNVPPHSLSIYGMNLSFQDFIMPEVIEKERKSVRS